jgi:hypothetical protein
VRDPNRIPRLSQRLSVLWQTAPDLRLGQLISWVSTKVGPLRDPFEVEDEEWERAIDEMIEAAAEREFSTKSIRSKEVESDKS